MSFSDCYHLSEILEALYSSRNENKITINYFVGEQLH